MDLYGKLLYKKLSKLQQNKLNAVYGLGFEM